MMFTCTNCLIEKPVTDYGKFTKYRPSWCKACRAKLEADRRRVKGIKAREFSRIENGEKSCMHCKKMLPLSMFAPSVRGKGGVAAYCDPCWKEKFYDKEKCRIWTGEYRHRHRGRWRGSHRIHQWEQRTGLKAHKDGTVTDEFMTDLYDTSHCYYCEEETPEDKRTADHKIALTKGGWHSASNLVMACARCNNRKKQLSPEEYLERLQNDHC